ncbi:MAG: apolipoprotein N-acyltransferase [Actinomycetes bacterium]
MMLSRLARSVTVASLLAGLLGGIVASMSLPPFGFWPVGILGVAMLLLACEEHAISRRSLTGFAFGLGLFVPGLWWAQHFNWYGALVLMGIEALFFAAAGAAMTPGRGRTLSAIGALTLAELLRERWPLGGLPIGGLPLGQTNGPLLDIARLGGPVGIMMAIVVAAAGARILSTSLAARAGNGSDAARRAVHGLGLLGVVVVVGLTGFLSPSGGTPTRLVATAAVQGGGERGTSAQQVDPASVTDATLRATEAVPPGTALTVLPEDVVGLSTRFAGSPEQAALSTQARRISTTLLAGVTTPHGVSQFDNFVVAFDAEGQVTGRVLKVHRVPFGEYVPARGLFSRVADLSGVARDATVGTGHEVLTTAAGRLGILISFEVFFSDRSADVVHHGAELLVVPTNTTSYPSAQMPAQELAAAQIQAVERGRDLVQASPTGYSAFISNDGVVTSRTALSKQVALLGTVALRDGDTAYTRCGDLPLIIVAAACLLAGQVRARRKTQSSS